MGIYEKFDNMVSELKAKERPIEEAAEALSAYALKQGGFVHPIVADKLVFPGMSLLDYFAGQALAAHLAANRDRSWEIGELATYSYNIAQAMVAEKRRREGGTDGK